MAIVKLNNDLKELYVQEQDEIRKILASLSEEAAQYIEEIRTDYRSPHRSGFHFCKRRSCSYYARKSSDSK